MAYYDALVSQWKTLNGTTAQKLATVNALTVQQSAEPVPIANVMLYLRSNNLWLPIKSAAAAGSSMGAIAAVDLNSDLRMATIDFSLPLVAQMLADLVSKNLLTQAQSDTLVAMGTKTVNWCYANGYPAEGPQGPGKLWAPDLNNAGLS